MIKVGTIGWDDRDDYTLIGEGDVTLVLVQLFEGRDITKPLTDPKVGHGIKMHAIVSSNIGRVPPKGTVVHVSVPDDYMHFVGLIIGLTEVNNTPQLATDRAVIDYGDQHVVIKAKSVTLMDQQGRFIAVGVPRAGGQAGLTFQDDKGAGGVIADGNVAWWGTDAGSIKSVLQLTGAAIHAAYNGSSSVSLIELSSGFVTLLADKAQTLSGNILLGVGPLYVPVLTGLTGPAGVGSTTIWGCV